MTNKNFQWQSLDFIDKMESQELFVSMNQCIFLGKDANGSICKVVDYSSAEIAVDWATAEPWLVEAMEQLQSQFASGMTLTVRVSNVPFVMIPDSLYSPEHKATYLTSTSRSLHATSVQTDEVHSLRQTSVYEFPLFLLQYFSVQQSTYCHWTTAFLGTVAQVSTTDRSIYAIISGHTLTIAVIKGAELDFVNEFNFHNAIDVLYYILLVYNTLELDPLNQELILLGQINQDGDIYTNLRKYIKNVHLLQQEALPNEVNYYNHLFSKISR